MQTYKIIGADGKEYGPITAEQLRQWIAEGRANSQTKILPEGTTEWRPLSEFPEFMPTITAVVPPAVPGAPPAPSGASAMVKGPATGLVIVAILGLILAVVSMITNLLGASLFDKSQMPNPALARMLSGPFAVISNLVSLLLSALILIGALKMKKLQSYGLAMTASIVAMLPCVGCCLIGLPIGIWSLVVLAKPEVKSAFN
ncbi:conserved membrane hypothetical protein [Verrucomicrobia bacterium]|nr:conserved membrane hypothetical protein [Verrucomicrobiota bacterium]